MHISGVSKKGFILVNILIVLMVINLISCYSIKLYINNKNHEENDYIDENEVCYASKNTESIISKLNMAIKDRTVEIDELRENKISEIVVYDGLKVVHGEEDNIFKIIYTRFEFQQRFFAIGEKINNSYMFKLYNFENSKEKL